MAPTTTTPPPPDASISPSTSLSYWTSTPATITGMLGGYPHISPVDLRGSFLFLSKLRRQYPSPSPNNSNNKNTTPFPLGLDCGAGIGRVTAGFLSKVCEVIDVVEPVEKFARGIPRAEMAGKGRVGDVYITGLESWKPEGGKKYDLIWNQWCLGHLTDSQLVEYLKRCAEAVTEGGWIVVKENMSTNSEGEDVFDEVDSSVTRTDGKFRALFERAGVRVWRSEVQGGFPRGIYPVRFYALRSGRG